MISAAALQWQFDLACVDLARYILGDGLLIETDRGILVYVDEVLRRLDGGTPKDEAFYEAAMGEALPAVRTS